MSSIVFYKILCFVHPGPLKGRHKNRIKHARILLREVVCVRENRENRERAGRPWSRLIPDPEWRQEEGWAKHLGLLCRLRGFSKTVQSLWAKISCQRCPGSLRNETVFAILPQPSLAGSSCGRCGMWSIYRGSPWWEGCKYILMVVTSILDSSETPKNSAMWGNILHFTLEVRFIGNIRKLPYVIE